MAEEADFVAGADAAGACENLKEHLAVLKADHLRQRGAARAGDFRKVIVSDVVGFHRDDVAGNLNDFVINLTHFPSFR